MYVMLLKDLQTGKKKKKKGKSKSVHKAAILPIFIFVTAYDPHNLQLPEPLQITHY